MEAAKEEGDLSFYYINVIMRLKGGILFSVASVILFYLFIYFFFFGCYYDNS